MRRKSVSQEGTYISLRTRLFEEWQTLQSTGLQNVGFWAVIPFVIYREGGRKLRNVWARPKRIEGIKQSGS